MHAMPYNMAAVSGVHDFTTAAVQLPHPWSCWVGIAILLLLQGHSMGSCYILSIDSMVCYYFIILK